MKKIVLISFIVFILVGCSSANKPFSDPNISISTSKNSTGKSSIASTKPTQKTQLEQDNTLTGFQKVSPTTFLTTNDLEYEVTRKRKYTFDKSTDKDISSSCTFVINNQTVEPKKKYKSVWSYTKFGDNFKEMPFDYRIFGFINNNSIEYNIDSKFHYESTNDSQLQNSSDKASEYIFATYKELESLNKYGFKNNILRNIFTKDIQLFQNFYKISAEFDRLDTFQSLLPDIFGYDYFRTKFTVNKFETKGKKFEIELTLNPQQNNSSFMLIFITDPVNKQIIDSVIKKIDKFEQIDKVDYTYNQEQKIIDKVIYTREVFVNKKSFLKDTYQIENVK